MEDGKTQQMLLTFKKYEKDLKIAGPVCMLFTKTGCIPHLTQETLSYLNEHLLNTTTFYEIPAPTITDFQETLQVHDGDCAELFCLSHSCLTCLLVQDPTKKAPKGYNTNKSVSIWTNGGRVNLTPTSYMSIVEALRPDIFESLSDGDVVETDSKKRVLKSVDRSLKFVEECIEICKNSKKLGNSKMICAIQGGHILKERKRFCKELSVLTKGSELVWGYTLDAPKDISDATKEIINCIREELDAGKPILVPGVGHPLSLIDYMKEGVFFFDSSYVAGLVEKKLALTYKMFSVDECVIDGESVNEGALKKFEETIDLSDKSYKTAFISIVDDCSCYTCKNHTCGYIHHLINVNEMLAPVLLTIHNLHHHLSFFKLLRSCIEKKVPFDTIKATLLHVNGKEEMV